MLIGELVHVTRGAMIESRHFGHIAVVDDEGALLASCGDPKHHTCARSAAKLIQALPVIESGAADYYRFTEEEIAVICASHNGEDVHVRTVSSILRKLGLDDSALRCGAHPPFHSASAAALSGSGRTPGPLHNNCSGKHSGMLALAKWTHAPLDDYLSPDHPVQRRMAAAVKMMGGLADGELTIGVDGCGVPVFGMPLDRLALAYARLGSGSFGDAARRAACRKIVGSAARHPLFIAGSERFDTRLIEVTNGKIIGKMGAEGVFAMTIPDRKIAAAVKIEDGSQRALYPTAVEVLIQLDALSGEQARHLRSFHQPELVNWQGIRVGGTTPVFRLAAPEHPA